MGLSSVSPLRPCTSLEKVSNLDAITFDVLILIVDALDLKSILKLGMVSKRLRHDITQTRVIWIRLLRAIAKIGYLPRHSFALDSKSVIELQRFSTCPGRFEDAVLSKTLGNTISTPFRLEFGGLGDGPLEADRKSWSELPIWVEPYLCPGGRWIVSLASDGTRVHALCWDLSKLAPCKKEKFLRPAASFKLPTPHLHVEEYLMGGIGARFIVQADESGQAANILLTYHAQSASDHQDVYEVLRLSFPSVENETPTFTTQATLKLPSTAFTRQYALTLEGDVVLTRIAPSEIIIWNWRLDTWALLDLGIETPLDYFPWLQPEYLHIFAHDFSCVSTYQLPELKAVSQPAERHMPTYTQTMLSSVEDSLYHTDIAEFTVLERWKPLCTRTEQIVAIMMHKWRRVGLTQPRMENIIFDVSPPSVSQGEIAVPRIRSRAPGTSPIVTGCSILPSGTPVMVDKFVRRDVNGRAYLSAKPIPFPPSKSISDSLSTLPENEISGISDEGMFADILSDESTTDLCGEPCFITGTFLSRTIDDLSTDASISYAYLLHQYI